MTGQPETDSTPIIILGGGPIGLALALELAWRGRRSTILEREEGTGLVLLAKAGGLNERTLEFCRRWGIEERVGNWGAPQDHPRDTVFVESLSGKYIGRDPLASLEDWPDRDSSPSKWKKCPQYIFDPMLAEACLKTGLVDIRYNSEVQGFVQDDTGVTVSYLAGEDATPRTLRGEYLAACDGSDSKVRNALGIPFDGDTLDYSLSIMLRVPSLERYHDMGRNERYLFMDENGTWANMTSVDYMDLWRLVLVGSEERLDPAKLDMEAVVKRAFANDDIPYEILRAMPWRRSQCTARHYRSGRVVLAGDAAHTTSPTGGHGLNTGLGDVFTLAWMLDAMVGGWGGPHLLDAYEVERQPVANRNSSSSTRNYNNWVGVNPDFSNVLVDGPEGDECRARIEAHFRRVLHEEWHSYGLAMGYRYDTSPVVVPDGTPATPDELSEYVQTARPGHRAPHAWLADGRSTIDLFGKGFVLLRLGASPPDVSPFVAAAAQRGMPLQVIDLADPKIAALYEKRLVLVRPDGHSAWRGDTLPSDVLAVIDTVRGAGAGAGGREPAAATQTA